jgi:hypothetical protein
MTKIEEKNAAEIFFSFFGQKLQFTESGHHKGRSSYRRSLALKK